ncbi:MAG: WYL domain-containing protein [Oscillospiraceae bacterium]|nr:WYL domain-containing protein [Oscillospiraceae bacterium]
MVIENRTRILYTLQILQNETDQEHPITIVEIIRLLKERWNVDAYRITVQQDIASLIEAGYPIVAVRSTQNRYYIQDRLFSVPELKLLIDAVEAGKFITKKKSRLLAEKLATLANVHDAGKLKRNISLADRVKSENEAGYAVLDVLNDAINAGVKVSFRYYEYSGAKRRVFKNGGKPYILSPYTLTWNGDFYYVVGWSEKHGRIAVFRVDRIADLPTLLEEPAVKKPKGYSIGAFTEKAFNMYDSAHETVTLLCENQAMNTVLDHFGMKIRTKPVDEGHFQFDAEVSVSPTFFSWIFEFGGMIRILGPESVKKAYRDMLRKQEQLIRGS